MEIVKDEDLCRYALIDQFDIIFYDSNDVKELYSMYIDFGKENFKGIYDHEQDRYLDEIDIIDLIGCQIHNE